MRLAANSDASQLTLLNRLVHAQHYDALPDHFLPLDEVTYVEGENMVGHQERMMGAVAERDGAVIGAIHALKAVVPEDFKNPGPLRLQPRIFINSIVVRPEERRLGVGTALIRFVEEWARSCGIRTVDLCCWSFNVAAQQFFLSRGFSPQFTQLTKDVA